MSRLPALAPAPWWKLVIRLRNSPPNGVCPDPRRKPTASWKATTLNRCHSHARFPISSGGHRNSTIAATVLRSRPPVEKQLDRGSSRPAHRANFPRTPTRRWTHGRVVPGAQAEKKQSRAGSPPYRRLRAFGRRPKTTPRFLVLSTRPPPSAKETHPPTPHPSGARVTLGTRSMTDGAQSRHSIRL